MTNLLIGQAHLKPLTVARIRAQKSPEGLLLRQTVALYNRLRRQGNLGSKSHEIDHPLRMLSNLELIAPNLRADLRVLKLAIIFHDLGIFFSQNPWHGPISAEIIRPHLSRLPLTGSEVDRICSAVRSHDDQTFPDGSTEAKALKMLDTLEAFGALGLYRYLEIYTRRGLQPPQIFEKALANLNWRYERLDRDLLTGVVEIQIDAAYERGKETLVHLVTQAQAGRQDDAWQIVAGLNSIVWNLKNLEAIVLPGYAPTAKRYYAQLRQELASWQR